MKVRSDFVTNSSSSSFILEIDVNMVDGSKIQLLHPEDCQDLYEDATNYTENSEEGFLATGEELLGCSDIDTLVTLLDESIELVDWGEDDEDYTGSGAREVQKKEFLNQLSFISSIEDIEGIEVRNRYSAWGEFSSCIVENDETLQELARNHIWDNNEETGKKLYDYLVNANNPSDEGDPDVYFGSGCARFSYKHNDMEEDLLKVANAIVEAVGDERGTEYLKINFKTGECESYAEIEIQ